jgi:hypothetical protein
LHIAAGIRVLLNNGVGLTVTVTFCTLVQLFAVNVYTYVTTTGSADVLTSVSTGLPVPVAAALFIPATNARLHPKAVPAVKLVGV